MTSTDPSSPRRLRRPAAAVLAAAVAASLFGLEAMPAAASPSASIQTTTDIVNGPVYAMAQAGERIYLGGSFSWAGPKTGGAVPVGDADGLKRSDARVIEGTAAAAVPDGAGGWVFGGSFNKTGGYFRNNLARMLPDGRINGTFNPNVKGGEVDELAVGGGSVYLAGTFTTVTETPRPGIAKVDLDTGALSSWQPAVAGTVRSMAVSPDAATVYIGTTSGLQAVDAATGASRASIGVTGAVNALSVSHDGATLYLGGAFDSADGQPRSNLAALEVTSGALTSWAPASNGPVHALAVSASHVYVGGEFTSLAGVARPGFGRVALDGSSSAWGPARLDPPAGTTLSVKAVAVAADGSKAYAGGNFVQSGNARVNRYRAAAYDTATGGLTPWHPSVEGDVLALAPVSTKVLVAGDFKMLNGAASGNVVALNASTGQIDRGFTATADATVRALAGAADGSRLYVGGDFGYVNGVRRRTVAALDGATGAVDAAWQADTNGAVRGLAVTTDEVYVTGTFTTIKGVARTRVAAVARSTGDVDPTFVPNVNEGVRAVEVSPDASSVFIGGRFNRVDGLLRPGMAQLSAATGRATSFAPIAGGVVIAVGLSPDGTRFYGSDESNITRAYDWATSNAPRWAVKTAGDVQAIAASGTEVYVGGHFTSANRLDPATNKQVGSKYERPRLASLLAADGQVTAWNPAPDGWFWGVWAIDMVPNGLAIAGEFTRVGPDFRDNFAVFSGMP